MIDTLSWGAPCDTATQIAYVIVRRAGRAGRACDRWRQCGAVFDCRLAARPRARHGRSAFVADPADPIGSAERALGGKAAIVFECVGVPGLIAQAVERVRSRGIILLLGLCTRPDTINTFAMLSKEVRLVTSAFFTRQVYEDALDALSAGAAESRLLVKDTIGLDATPVTFEALKRRTHQCKVLIAP